MTVWVRFRAAVQSAVAMVPVLRSRPMLAGGVGVAALALIAALFFGVGSGGCSERAAAEARVSALSAALQESAASGKITTPELAARMVRLNSAATTFETTKDLTAYCEALDQLSAEFQVGR